MKCLEIEWWDFRANSLVLKVYASEDLPNISRWVAVSFVNGTLAGHGHHSLVCDPTDHLAIWRWLWRWFWVREKQESQVSHASNFCDIATMVSNHNLLGINDGKPRKMRKKHKWGSLPHAVRYCQNRANYGQLWQIYFENHAISDYSGDLDLSLVIRRMILQAEIEMTSFRKGPIATSHATLALLFYLIPRRGWSKSNPGSAAIISRILDRILRLEWKPSATGDSLKVIKVNESSSAFDFHATMLQHVESWFLRSTQGPFGRSCPSVQGPTSRAVG